VAEPPGDSGEESGTERVAAAGRVEHRGRRDRGHLQRRPPRPGDAYTLGPRGGDPGADPVEDVALAPAGAFPQHRGLVGVGEQEAGALDETPGLVAAGAGELLRRVGDEGVAAATALVGVAQHGLGVVGGDHHEVEVRDAPHRRFELHLLRLGHRTCVEGGDLVLIDVRRAHEARGPARLAGPHRHGVDAVRPQPAAVVGEVDTGRAHKHGFEAEPAEGEGDVGGDTSPADLQVVGEEGQRDLVELFGDQLLGKASGIDHQMVDGDGSGDGDAHVVVLLESAGAGGEVRRSDYSPAAVRSASTRSVFSQVKSGSSRPK
jgi:hypothetical protein